MRRTGPGRAIAVLAAALAAACAPAPRATPGPPVTPPTPATPSTPTSESSAAPTVAADAHEAAPGPVGLPTPAPAWLKGQLHLHTGRSGDCTAPPDEVVTWYAAWGFDFIVVTDHNVVTELPNAGPMLVIPGVELTLNSNDCEPRDPATPKCRLHINALFVRSPAPAQIPWGPRTSKQRVDIYQRALDAASALGGIAQLNHPNFHWGADAALAAELVRRGVVLMEVANQAMPISNRGDARHPSVEELWDLVLTSGARVWGTATDDAHHYDDAAILHAGGSAYTGNRGWVMVRAARDPQAIREALVRGEFYASTGVLLDRLEVVDGVLVIDVRPDLRGGVPTTTFIGTGGRVLAREAGSRVRYRLAHAGDGYVRAVVVDEWGRKAWIQPIFLP